MIVFISPPYLHLGIINSQLLKIAEYTDKKTDIKVLIYGDKKDIESNLDKNENKYEIIYYKSFFKIYQLLKQSKIIYLRQVYFLPQILALKYAGIINPKIVYDFRALTYKESWYRNKNIINYIVLFVLEFMAYCTADKVCAISKVLAKNLQSIFYKREITVIPCAIEKVELKEKHNKVLPLQFIYSGSMNRWQNFEEILKFYKKISTILNCELTIYTLELEEAKRLTLKYNVNVKEIKTLSNFEVNQKLKNFDFGFLIRENLFLNRVSSPIKFMEYVSSGVIPIITNYVGDYSKDVKDLNLGYIHNIGAQIDIERIICLTQDENIYTRLYNYSINYTWSILMKKHPINILQK